LAIRSAGPDHRLVHACDFHTRGLHADTSADHFANSTISSKEARNVPLPRPDALQPYQASVDSNHNVWTNIMNRDEVMKFDVRTSQWTEYPVPTLGAEMRYFSILEHNGSMQLIMPYSRTKKLRG
jgi:hypothetical protein